MKKFSRRDTLKLAVTAPLGLALSQALTGRGRVQSPLPNVVFVVLDALTAQNMSLHGYPRNTTPNIERFAQRSIVYHAHYASGSFTTPGTASLLTGMYPWTHRATSIAGQVQEGYLDRNIFHLLGSSYNRLAFTQNINAEILLRQFDRQIDRHLPLASFSEMDQYVARGVGGDSLTKYRAMDGFLFANRPGSLLFGAINKYGEELAAARMQKQIDDHALQYFERDLFFNIEKVFAGLASTLEDTSSPFWAYFHLYPPHEPYVPGADFAQLFNDDWKPIGKPGHKLLVNWDSNRQLRERRLLYDQYVATVDHAFGQFMDALERKGLLENTLVALTSDHGQMFERGLEGHVSPLLYESAIHVPLLVSLPGQSLRKDVFSVTNNVDILPTLLQFSGLTPPDWNEGRILPGLGGMDDPDRAVFAMDAKDSPANSRLKTISIAMRRGRYKLIYYTGYTAYRGYPEDPSYNEGAFELYDLEEDPEELQDMASDAGPSIFKPLKEELLDAYNRFGGKPA